MSKDISYTDLEQKIFYLYKEAVMSLINKEVGEFSVQGFHKGDFVEVSKKDILGKWSVFFFYPADFTFVCPTELED